MKRKFQIELVLADSLYGESGDVINLLERLKLPFIVAIRSNHSVLVAPGQKLRYNRSRVHTFNPSPIGNQKHATFVKLSLVKPVRSAQSEISKTDSPTTHPLDTWFVMTNLPKS